MKTVMYSRRLRFFSALSADVNFRFCFAMDSLRLLYSAELGGWPAALRVWAVRWSQSVVEYRLSRPGDNLMR